MQDIVICGKAVDSTSFKDALSQLHPKTILHLPGAIRLEGVEAPDDAIEKLASLAEDAKCDCLTLPAGLSLQRIRLFCFDLESTLIENEGLNDIAAEAGVPEEVQELTRRGMAGELDFFESIRRRVALLAGQPASLIDRAIQKIRLNPGAKVVGEFARRNGIAFYIVSGGFIEMARTVASWVGATGAVSNELIVKNGRLTGEVTGPAGNEIICAAGKRRVVQGLAQLSQVSLKETLCCGDGANDIEMVRSAGLGIAYHAKPVLEAATPLRIRHTGLETIPLLFRESWDEAEVL